MFNCHQDHFGHGMLIWLVAYFQFSHLKNLVVLIHQCTDNLVIYINEVCYVLTTKGSLLEMSFDQNPIGGVVKGLPSTLKVNKRTLDFIDKVGNPKVIYPKYYKH